MAVTSARNIVKLKDKGHFEPENARIDKYTLADELPAQLSELGLRPRSMAQIKPGYTIRKLTPADREPVLEFLSRFFFRDEPMNLAVNLLEHPNSRCVELEEYSTASLKEGVSVAAVDEKGEFVGIVINGVVHKDDDDHSDDKDADSCDNPKFQRILKVLAYLDEEAKIWEKLPPSCHSVMEVRIASTHSGWRGRGLMKALCDESELIAKSVGASAMRMDATSAFSAAAAERLNYKKVYSVRYAELPDAPQPTPPHVEARVYIKELD